MREVYGVVEARRILFRIQITFVVWLVEVVLVGVVMTHATNVASAVLEDVHSVGLLWLYWSSLLTVSTVRDACMVPHVAYLWKEALLGAHRELLVSHLGSRVIGYTENAIRWVLDIGSVRNGYGDVSGWVRSTILVSKAL